MKTNKIKTNYLYSKVSKAIWILFFTISLNAADAAHCADTSIKKLLAAVSAKNYVGYITQEANVVFPEALAGNENETLAYIEQFSENRRAYLIRTHKRSQKFFPKVTAVLKKHKLPQELKVLLALESAFNANAVSKAGAVGYWQIMDEVAKEYGLKYIPREKEPVKKKAIKIKGPVKKEAAKPVKVKDDRVNFYKSTNVAARYLKDRSRNLDNNLLLMVASYNCGIGNVWEAMKKTGKTEPCFWDIKASLPAETQAYVMNFITLNVIFHNYDKFTDNSLLFTPTKVKMEKTDGVMTEALNSTLMQH